VFFLFFCDSNTLILQDDAPQFMTLAMANSFGEPRYQHNKKGSTENAGSVKRSTIPLFPSCIFGDATFSTPAFSVAP